MFERPLLLWLFALSPIVAAPALIAVARGQRWVVAIASGARLGCFALVILAAAGLRFPFHAAAHGLTAVVALDESGSIAMDQFGWMAREVERLKSLAASEDRIAILGFGRDARILAPPEDPRLISEPRREADRGGTDIASALVTAAELFAPETEKKILLLSDGNETVGGAAAEIPALIHQGIKVFTAAPPPSSARRVALVAFEAPDVVRARKSFAFHIDVESEAPMPTAASLKISEERGPLGARTMELRAGLNRFELPYAIERPGAYILSAEIAPLSAMTAVSTFSERAISVLPPARVLAVSGEPDSSAISALRARGYQVDLTRPGTLPQRAEDYLNYQTVILLDAPAQFMPAETQRALNRYVADFGGGVIAAGQTLTDEGYRDGALEAALPVKFRPQPPPPTREPVAIYLCIDRSNSMSYNSRYPAVRDNERIRYAKQAAIALLRQLDDTDYAGVIAFDSQPYVLSRLSPLGQSRTELENRVARLQPGGGTDFKEALEIAEREIIDSRIGVRQVILLTDGDTNRQYHDHDDLIADFSRQRIPVSTIRIGPDLANLRLLEDFAQATGGVFYRVEDIEKLPQLFVRLTRQAMSKTPQGQIKIRSNAPSTILSGIKSDEVPPLEFFAVTDAKESASVPLIAQRAGSNAPLLAAWQYGLGRSAIFAADPDSLAALGWIHWDRYVQFWSQLLSWVMRPGQGGMFDLRIAPAEDGSVTFEAEKADKALLSNLYCRVTGAGRAFDIAMTPAGEALYRGDSAPLPRGKYTATLVRKVADNEQALSSRVFAVVGPSPADSAEQRLRPPNLELLRAIAERTGGAFNPDLSKVLAHTGPTVTVYRSVLPWLLPPAILLLLIDVFIRRRFAAD